MNANVGGTDRNIRIVVGLAVLSLVFLLDGAVRWLGLIGLVPLVTAAAGYCPLYAILGVSTCASTVKPRHV
jgi:hypothetical protein